MPSPFERLQPETVLSKQPLQDIQCWISRAKWWNSTPILKRGIDRIIQTDTFLTGWGVVHVEQEAASL